MPANLGDLKIQVDISTIAKCGLSLEFSDDLENDPRIRGRWLFFIMYRLVSK